jgi:hypothetical protein
MSTSSLAQQSSKRITANGLTSYLCRAYANGPTTSKEFS